MNPGADLLEFIHEALASLLADKLLIMSMTSMRATGLQQQLGAWQELCNPKVSKLSVNANNTYVLLL